MENTRKLMKKVPIDPKNLKKMFVHTLEKLKKYKNESKTMQDKILDLQSALEFKNIMLEQIQYLSE